MDRISPTGDLAFKKTFASEEHKDVLAGLIGDIFIVEEEREVAMTLERAQADYDAGLVSSYFDGKAEGKAEEKVVIAKKLLRRNMALEDISEDTGLSLDVLQKLKNEIGQ